MRTWKSVSQAAAACMMAAALTAGCAAAETGKIQDSSDKPAAASRGAEKALPAETSAAQQNRHNTGTTNTVGNNGQASSPPVKTADEPADARNSSEKLYKMNKAYMFVPIDNQTPAKVVLLTFDDGPKEDGMVSAMLDTLDKHKAKAIFFVNGYRVKRHPELLKKIAERGQTIGNHSWDHIDLKKESDEAVHKQLSDVQKIVKDTVGAAPVFFRPPFGSGGDRVKRIANEQGMLFMTWSDGSLDWDSSTKKDPGLVIKKVLEQLHPGANILMHELPWTVKGLDLLLTKLEEKGYGFIDPSTIDLGLDGPAQTAK